MGNLWDTIKEQKLIILSILATLTVVVVIGVIMVLTTSAEKMRLVQIEGDVILEHGGSEGTIMSVGKLIDGDALRTGQEAWAQISLDSTKYLTLENGSRVELGQDGKKYVINLTEGELFFNVSKYLEANESLTITTPIMHLGITGTSGYVSVDEAGTEWLYLLDGKVHITVTNPYTGEVASKDVYEGHKISVKFYQDQTEDRGSVEFVIEGLTEKELPVGALREFTMDKVLLRRVVIATGFSEERLLEMANQALNQPVASEPEEEPEEEVVEEPVEEPTEESEEPEEKEPEEEETEEEEPEEETTTTTTPTRTQRNNNNRNNNQNNNQNNNAQPEDPPASNNNNQNNNNNNNQSNNQNNNQNNNNNNNNNNQTPDQTPTDVPQNPDGSVSGGDGV